MTSHPTSTVSKTNLASSSSPSASAPASPPVVTPIDPGVVAQCTALLAQVAALVNAPAPLSTSAIRRMLKLRKGGAQVVTDLLALCTTHGISSVGQVTVAEMTAHLDRANALNQIGVELAAVTKQIGDAAFTSESVTWQNATTLYTVLRRLAVRDPTLAAGLGPIQDFFQTKRTKGKKRANAQAKALKDAQALVAGHAPSPPTSALPSPAVVQDASAPAASVTNGAARL